MATFGGFIKILYVKCCQISSVSTKNLLSRPCYKRLLLLHNKSIHFRCAKFRFDMAKLVTLKRESTILTKSVDM